MSQSGHSDWTVLCHNIERDAQTNGQRPTTPPELPLPMTTLMRGTRRPNISLMFVAMASPCMVIIDQAYADRAMLQVRIDIGERDDEQRLQSRPAGQ